MRPPPAASHGALDALAKSRETERDSARTDPINRAFGDRIRGLREGANLTLEQFAKQSGVSRAMLSKVERGEKSPTIGVAKRIAHALRTPLSVLMGDESEHRAFALVRRDERPVFRDSETGFERHLLSPIMAGMSVELVLHKLPPRAATGTLPRQPVGFGKHVTVIGGEVTIGCDQFEVTLQEGDTLYFEADVEHSFRNGGDRASEYYVVISAPLAARGGQRDI